MIGRSHAHSPCGLHETKTYPCVHCARAHAANAAALDDVIPTHKNGQPLKRTEENVAEVRRRVAAGESVTEVARSLGASGSQVGKIAKGTLGVDNLPATSPQRAGMYRRGNAEEREVRKTVPYPKQAAG